MKIYTMTELLALHRDQLLDLHEEMSRHLMVLSADTNERREALENLVAIRRILNRPVRVYRHGGFAPPAP